MYLSRFKSSLLYIKLNFKSQIFNKHFFPKVERMRRRVQRGVTFSERGATHYQFVTSRSNLVVKFCRFLRDEVDVAKYGKERWSHRELIKNKRWCNIIYKKPRTFSNKPGAELSHRWKQRIVKNQKDNKNLTKQTNKGV